MAYAKKIVATDDIGLAEPVELKHKPAIDVIGKKHDYGDLKIEILD